MTSHVPTPSVPGVCCPFCHGSGSCTKCQGHGTRIVRRTLFGREIEADCIACERSGECRLCGGRGHVGVARCG